MPHLIVYSEDLISVLPEIGTDWVSVLIVSLEKTSAVFTIITKPKVRDPQAKDLHHGDLALPASKPSTNSTNTVPMRETHIIMAG